MGDELTPQDIKRIRGRYGLTQKAFARVLGIGEASIVRYENGQKPTRANANLIRAANIPAFMLDCLERDGSRISQDQRERTERIIYSEVMFDEEGEVMDINDIYEITLTQEILNEQAAEIMADLWRMSRAARDAGDETSALIYEDAATQVSLAKYNITTEEYASEIKLAELRGQIEAIGRFAQLHHAKVA
ncbi:MULTISPECIES: helix-turn-helix domain-containing protein [unclassified Adlercreutzia]|uniref:helix-turn-helix domain-containing protein n=1 Tax=unclassified Adlercreutzia TaxID=2636013 RepID=UPI0013EB1287|nr:MULTISPECIES: helix-turn-helix domain-containing protein [unclassified Adlercreutzia]